MTLTVKTKQYSLGTRGCPKTMQSTCGINYRAG